MVQEYFLLLNQKFKDVIRLTIKHRLLISNILMIVIPIILTYATINILIFTFLDSGISSDTPFQLTEIKTILQGDVTMYQLDTNQYVLVLPESMNQQFEDLVGTYSLHAPLSEQEFQQLEFFYNHSYVPLLIVFFISAVFVILVHRILTPFVFKPIMTSINVLVNGVQEISDGNLAYQIKQNMGNEFDVICANFNEMATRLLKMVTQRQADEKNRKELIAGISHDLRTPLTSIKAYLEGIRKGVASTPDMKEKYFDTIQSKTEDMAYMIDQLFLFSKIDIGEFPFHLESVNVGDELTHIVAELSPEYAKKGLHISIKENVAQMFVLLDVVQFRNVIQNILTNSEKYGNKNCGVAEIYCRKQHEKVVITIEDNGSGVPKDMLTKIFDVFYRRDTSRNSSIKGSGLGLAICSKIIERLNGKIDAENVVDGGLRVMITLPLDLKMKSNIMKREKT